MEEITISAIGLADDVVLTTNNIYNLYNLLHITLSYCSKYKVDLVADKTKLQVFLPSAHKPFQDYFLSSCPLEINSQFISFSNSAEHVGVIRSTSGNLPHILGRISSHQKDLRSLLSAGLAKNHRANPSASLRVNKLHGIPVLMSGLGSLVLKKSEIAIIHHHHKKTLVNLQKLHSNTPDPVIYFLAGTLPGSAVLHLRQLTLFGMISRLPGSVLHQHALRVLTTAKSTSMSWFIQIRNLCLQYSLPHPLSLLDHPIEKEPFKKHINTLVQDYWQEILRAEARKLNSLSFLKTCYLSLSNPHPIWTTAKYNPYETNKAII